MGEFVNNRTPLPPPPQATLCTSGLLLLVALVLGKLLIGQHGVGWDLALLHHAGQDAVAVEQLQVVRVSHHGHGRVGVGAGTDGRVEWADTLADASVVWRVTGLADHTQTHVHTRAGSGQDLLVE